MRTVIQRVTTANVTVEGTTVAEISNGLLVFLGVENSDSKEDIEWLTQKIINMRIFSDTEGKMNLSVKDIKGDILVISQFTLYAATKKGNRPSFTKAAAPEFANKMYEAFVENLKTNSLLNIQKGVFAADMKIQLLNDGPVTIVIDTKNKE